MYTFNLNETHKNHYLYCPVLTLSIRVYPPLVFSYRAIPYLPKGHVLLVPVRCEIYIFYLN